MTSLNVIDANTGKFLSVDTENPAGNLYVIDANTGEFVLVDLSNPVGSIYAIDANTGQTVLLDYAALTGTIDVIDPVSGHFVAIDFDNPLGIFYTMDENSGNFVQVNLTSDVFFKEKNLVIPGIGERIAPICVITMSDYALKIGDTATVTFTFSEEVLNFTVADVTSSSGSLSSFGITGNHLVYTATFTPTNGLTNLTNIITVGTNWTDLNGNPPASSTNSANYEVDTIAPTVTITCSQTPPSITTPLNFTFTFSKGVTGFVVGDITAAVSGGTVTKTNFLGSGSTYTCDLAPSVTGTLTVDIAANACQDSSGNNNVAATQFTFSFIKLTFQVDFSTDDASPLASPYTGEIGSVTKNDSLNKLAVASGKLTVSTNVSIDTTGDPSVGSDAITRVTGLGVAIKAATEGSQPGFVHGYIASLYNSTSRSDASVVAAFAVNGNTGFYAGTDTYISYVSDEYHSFYFVLKSSGHFMIIDDKLVFVRFSGTTNPIYAGYNSRSVGCPLPFVDHIRAATLPSPWNTDFGICTGYTASPGSGAILTHTADGMVTFNWTVATNEVLELDIRRTDNDNRWIVRLDQAAKTMKLIERNAGVETERASATGLSMNNGANHNITVKLYDIHIHGFWDDGALKIFTYDTASFNKTATGAKVSGFTTGANFATYPRTLTGTALDILRTVSP